MKQTKGRQGRLLTSAVTVIIAGGISLSLAQPVSASTVSVESNCNQALTVYASPGDTIAITLGVGCPSLADLNTFLSSGIGPDVSFLRLVAFDGNEEASDGVPGDLQWGALRGDVPTTVTVELLAQNANGDPLDVGALLAVVDEESPEYTVSYGGAPASPPGAPGASPLPWHQSYARANAEAMCIVGWSPSYAMWPNDGKGGWVCNRTLLYNNSTKMWDVK